MIEMVGASFKEDARTVCLKFNGWQFQGFEDAKIALIEGVLSGLLEARPLLTKVQDLAQRAWGCLDKLKLLKGMGKLGVALHTGIPLHGSGLADIVGAIGGNASVIALDEDKRSDAIEGFEGAVRKDAKFARPSAPHAIAEFRASFKALIKEADIDRLVVLVDDLDRCLPETAIETLEAMRLFVLMDKTAFVIGADERMIEYAVRQHFPDLPEMEDSQGYARAYLEKLIQVPFRIPALGETETRIYVTLLLLGAALDRKEDESVFAAVLDLGRAALSRPWDGEGLAEQDIKRVLGERMEDLRSALTTAEQVSPLLAAGTKGNPRQIKRFLNALALRLAVAEARGFGEAIEQTRLAKLMLAELFLPESVFSFIATSAANNPDGRCRELVAIENLAAGRTAPSSAGADEAEDADTEKGAAESAGDVVDGWSLQPDVMRWARVAPELGAGSLKPYLFVIKDRRNFLAAEAPLSPALRALLARLIGGKATAAAATPELRGLGPADLNALMGALRSQALASPSFDQKPPALVGIETLVGTVPALQEQYVDVLEALPAAKLNAWASAGYEPIVKGPDAKARLNRLLVRWAREGSSLLKKALAGRPKEGAKAGGKR